MPSFVEYGVEVDVDIDITIDEFLSECSSREIKELIDSLIKDGHLSGHSLSNSGVLSLNESDFTKKTVDLASKYYSMSNEDIKIIEDIHRKYC